MENPMKTMKQLTAVALLLGTATVAQAGKGGSAAAINAAVSSGGQDAILAEVERSEALICIECTATLTQLTTDDRYPVRQVAAWWFGKRPGLQQKLAVQFEKDLTTGDSIHVRNAADFLATTKEYKALPQLRAAMTRGGLSLDAKLALVRGAGVLAHTGGNPILVAGMHDGDASVRAASIAAYRDVLGQTDVSPIEPALADADAHVRAEAATVIGAYRDGNGRAQLEKLVTTDPDISVRRNAAWALGKIGSAESKTALQLAAQDASPTVAGVAKASLVGIHAAIAQQ